MPIMTLQFFVLCLVRKSQSISRSVLLKKLSSEGLLTSRQAAHQAISALHKDGYLVSEGELLQLTEQGNQELSKANSFLM